MKHPGEFPLLIKMDRYNWLGSLFPPFYFLFASIAKGSSIWSPGRGQRTEVSMSRKAEETEF